MVIELVRQSVTRSVLTAGLEVMMGTLILYYMFRWFIRRLQSGKNMDLAETGEWKCIPRVSGGLPIIGHGLEILRDPAQFMSDCYKKYGEVYIIQIFKRTVVILCNRNLARTFLKETEEDFSFENALNDLNFDWPFYEGKQNVFGSIALFRKILSIKEHRYRIMPKIEAEAKKVVDTLLAKCSKGDEVTKVSVNEISQRFICKTSLMCFAGTELKDDVLAGMTHFAHTVSAIVMSSYFIPKSMLKLLFSWKVGGYRRGFVSHFLDDIQRYREDESLVDAILLRIAIDHDDERGVKLTNPQVAELLLNFMFVSSENTSVGLTNAITFLMLPQNAKILERLREECKPCLHDTDKLLNLPFMNAVVLETARLSSHLLAIHRVPARKNNLGDYVIPNDVGTVVLSSHMLMADGCASDIYNDPLTFNPDRFLGKSPELRSPPGILTWGGGRHTCPGKMFAMFEIKVVLAHLFSNFDLEIDGELPKFKYFLPIGFANREVNMRVKRRKVDAIPARKSPVSP